MASIVRSYTTDTNVPIIVHVAIDVSQTINVGDLVQIDATSRKGEVAVAASTTIVGIAMEPITTGGTVTDADTIPVALVRGQVVRIAYATGGTKTSFADTDKYTTAYDLSNKTTLNPDDTTGGMCYVQDYDNTQDTVDVIFAAASLANVG
jgi:hypothetical protein